MENDDENDEIEVGSENESGKPLAVCHVVSELSAVLECGQGAGSKGEKGVFIGEARWDFRRRCQDLPGWPAQAGGAVLTLVR